MKVVVAGATGFVGMRLVEQLNSIGHAVVILTRNTQKATRQFPKAVFPNVDAIGYTPTVAGEWGKIFSDCDAVVNLAGAPLSETPWSQSRKQEILRSRQLGTRQIVEAMKMASPKPKVLVNASAVGYYGTDPTQEFDEYSLGGNDFLAGVCKAWEAEADAAEALGVRVVKLRNGIVMGLGGFLGKVLPIFQLGAGGKLGSGQQWLSWIHRDDLVNLIIFALTNEQIKGAVNATTPHPVTNEEFTQALAKVVKRPAPLPVPAFALQALLGEASILALEGQKVLPKKAAQYGFQFQYPTINLALAQIV
ncbi:TIGR01777 family oxidoreductase [Pseudanabaena sp. PCC 6802]|uniref:thylakoid membrane protein ThyD n=1 Tax=Pseudanabaena sp. PCC 6802 TaxID=118173 RepID=UPI00034CA5D9|nr:TIGR01777 family oxidoreductase [Pseudanabaena sp. PCC 6802]